MKNLIAGRTHLRKKIRTNIDDGQLQAAKDEITSINGELKKLRREVKLWQPKPSRQPAAVSILTATAASGRTMPTTTGMSAPAVIRKIQQRIPPANGSSTPRQLLQPTAQSIRNAPSAVIRWQPKLSRQPAAVSILTATAASGRTMPTTTGMSAPAAIRKIQQRIPPANGSSIPRQQLPQAAQSIRNAPSAVIR